MTSIGQGSRTDFKFWRKALAGKTKNRDFLDFLERRGFRAGVDVPIAWFYK